VQPGSLHNTVISQEKTGLAASYLAALRTALRSGPRTKLPAAAVLGRRAARLGLGVVALTRMHGKAMRVLGVGKRTGAAGSKDRAPGDRFFQSALMAMGSPKSARPLAGGESAQPDAGRPQARAPRPPSAGSEAARDALRLGHSVRAEARLRARHRRALAATEAERRALSQELQNKVAQVMIAVQNQLLLLRREVSTSRANYVSALGATLRTAQRLLAHVRRAAGGGQVHT
jgi:signal transduction histidine kinase